MPARIACAIPAAQLRPTAVLCGARRSTADLTTALRCNAASCQPIQGLFQNGAPVPSIAGLCGAGQGFALQSKVFIHNSLARRAFVRRSRALRGIALLVAPQHAIARQSSATQGLFQNRAESLLVAAMLGSAKRCEARRSTALQSTAFYCTDLRATAGLGNAVLTTAPICTAARRSALHPTAFSELMRERFSPVLCSHWRSIAAHGIPRRRIASTGLAAHCVAIHPKAFLSP
jgi:hypothetical protein